MVKLERSNEEWGSEELERSEKEEEIGNEREKCKEELQEQNNVIEIDDDDSDVQITRIDYLPDIDLICTSCY